MEESRRLGRKWILDRIGSRSVTMDEELWAIRSWVAEGVQVIEWYPVYLRSKWWDWLRRQALERDGNACVRCGSQVELHVDHLWYRGIGEEALADVQTLCRVCHQKKSRFRLGGRKVIRLDADRLYKTLRR